MKKNLLTVIGFFLLAGLSGRAEAQTTANSGRHENIPFTAISGKDSTLKSGPILINNISARAIRDFTSSYKNPSDIRWVVLTDGFLVHCYDDGFQIRIYYDVKGRRTWMVRSYGENKLPPDVRHIIRSQYYDFNIFSVTEINSRGRIIYIVKIADSTKWKTLNIEDGDMICTEEFDKG
jgi:hypothetical protein